MKNKWSKWYDKKAASPPPHADGSVVFARVRQCAPHLTHASLDPPESVHPNGSAVFAGLAVVMDGPTDRQTEHATPSVTIGRIYVRSTATRPKNTVVTGNITEQGKYKRTKTN